MNYKNYNVFSLTKANISVKSEFFVPKLGGGGAE